MSWDKLRALGTGAGQAATGGLQDELVAKLLAAMPVEDETGIPRTYAGGQYEQYRDNARADNADLQARFPANYATGQVAGALPSMAATASLGGLPAVGAGVAQGALAGFGASERSGKELAKDAAAGGALGGALGAGANLASAAGPALARLWKNGPPGPAPAFATSGAKSSGVSPRPRTPSNINMSESVQSFRPPVREAMRPVPRTSTAPVAMPEIPRPGKTPKFDEAEMDLAEQRLRQTEESFAKRHDAKYGAKAQEIRNTATVKPPRKVKKAEAPVPAGAPSTWAEIDEAMPPMPDDPAQVGGWRDSTEALRSQRAKLMADASDAAMARLRGMAPESKIGEGWARSVHDDAGSALKIAKGDKGLAQNRAEASLSGRNPALNPVTEHAPDYSWVRQPKVTPFADAEDMAAKLGVQGDPDGQWLSDLVEGRYAGARSPALDELEQRLTALRQAVPEIDARDLGKFSQYGLDASGQPVVLDYGFLKKMSPAVAGVVGQEFQDKKR